MTKFLQSIGFFLFIAFIITLNLKDCKGFFYGHGNGKTVPLIWQGTYKSDNGVEMIITDSNVIRNGSEEKFHTVEVVSNKEKQRDSLIMTRGGFIKTSIILRHNIKQDTYTMLDDQVWHKK